MTAAEKTDWRAIDKQIIKRLDILKEYRGLGVRFASDSPTPKPTGWVECHAIDREDSASSAAINVQTGRYKDLGGDGASYSLWDFAVRYGPFTDWREARAHFAKLAGVPLPNGQPGTRKRSGKATGPLGALGEKITKENQQLPKQALNRLEPLSNAIIEDTPSGGEQVIPLTMEEITARIRERTHGWPKTVGGRLFARTPGLRIMSAGSDRYSPYTTADLIYLDSTAELFAWLQGTVHKVDWRRSQGCVTKEEVYHGLRYSAEPFESIEGYPHEPEIKGCFYNGVWPTPRDGQTLEDLLDFFDLEEELDRELLTVAFATPLWGGPAGARPGFMFTAAGGRGKGKSTLAMITGQLYGGAISVSPREDFEGIKTRLLSPDALGLRCALLDNVKSPRFSWGQLEGLLTCNVISGRRLYAGEGSRPNYLTWLVTLNGAALSTDLAQRFVEIRLDEPKYSAGWEAEVQEFIRDKQDYILGDLTALLRRRPQAMERHLRWGTWESQVLSKLPHSDDCLALIEKRRQDVDVEVEEGVLVETYFNRKLQQLGYDTERDDVFIPSQIATQWFGKAIGEKMKAAAVTRALKQMWNEKRIERIFYSRYGHASNRGFRWIGEHAIGETFCDLERRIAEKLESEKRGF